MQMTKTLLYCTALIGIVMPCAAFAQISMLPPTQSGTATTVCSPSASGKILSWDGNSSIKCQAGIVVDSSGKMGIGTATPNAQLDVVGGVKIGMDSGACTTATPGKTGTLRYNSGQLEVCNGGWASIAPAGITYVGSCTTPKSSSKDTSCKCGAGETLMMMSGFNGSGNWGDSVNCRVINQNTLGVTGYAFFAASVSGTCTYACFK